MVEDLADDPAEHNLALSALAYVAAGFPVFPVLGKTQPLTEHGCKDASCDLAQVRRWWRTYPHANIAFATGAAFWALDVDPRHGGDAALAELERTHGALPDTVRVLTGNGGTHYYFSADERIGCSTGGLPPGLDVKGAGGYVIAPPSIHPETGRFYTFEIGAGLGDIAQAAGPTWLADMILADAPRGRRATDDPGEPIPKGRRHHTLLRHAGKLRWLGYGAIEILAVFRAINATRCVPPLEDDELAELAEDVARRYGQGRGTTSGPASEEPIEDRTEEDSGLSGDDVWPDPLPLDAVAVPACPLDALPPVLADVVVDIATVTQTPVDLAGLGVLTVIGAMGARRIDVAIAQTHIEPLNLFAAVVAGSGERKGPVLRAVLSPVYALEHQLRVEAEPGIATAREARKLAEKRLERLRDAAARCEDPAEREKIGRDAIALASRLPIVPPTPTLSVSDRTVEKLEVELAQQAGALLLASEEAGTVIAIAGGRYSRDGAAQLDTFLKAYDRGEIDTARISREAVRCSTPELSILVTPQPFLL
jgi:Protein of unknown function (DUF3987)/Bifunctional DNA primase/polymerase, N-terminal/Primase C terminal 1 (PriCT-1)